MGRWVGGRLVAGSVSKSSVVGWSVGRWSVDLIKPLKKREPSKKHTKTN